MPLPVITGGLHAQVYQFSDFMRYLFDDPKQAEKAGEIARALLEAQSPRLSNIAERMVGRAKPTTKPSNASGPGGCQTLPAALVPGRERICHRRSDRNARHAAPKTAYVGTLSDGETPGYWLMSCRPHFGESIPFHFITYSSKTIGERAIP